jgi:hypothetical protein
MPVYRPEEYESEYLEKLRSGLGSVLPKLPPGLLPPAPRETGQAWREVIEEKPTAEGTYLPFMPKVNLSKLGKAAYGTASAVASVPGLEFIQPLQIRGFHGSPYKFSKFENKAIGSGEGAQAFGYGHYITESPEVAKWYKKPPTGATQGKQMMYEIPGLTVEEANKVPSWIWNDLARYQEQSPKDVLRVIDDFESQFARRARETQIKIKEGKSLQPWILEEQLRNVNDVVDTLQKTRETIQKGAKPDFKLGGLYETTIHKGKQPSEYTYLEWDKPIGKKAESVKPLMNIGKEEANAAWVPRIGDTAKGFKPAPLEQWTGKDIYEWLESKYSSKEASNILNKAGISGIKYPTGSLSGMKGTKEYNYVVFNPEDITIEKVK